MKLDLDNLPDDTATLHALIAEQSEYMARLEAKVRARDVLVEALKIKIARLKRQRFGKSSEKLTHEIEQLQLALEDLEIDDAALIDADHDDDAQPTDKPSTPETTPKRGRRKKLDLPEDAPREEIVLDPGEICSQCGGQLRLVGQDVSEILDFIAARLKIIRTTRLTRSCRDCETIVQSPAPSRPIAKGLAGPGLLAHILVAKFDDHLPLYRQGEIFARHGITVPRSTLVDWCGGAIRTLRPLAELLKSEVMTSRRLHGDDTPIPMLDPRNGKKATTQARIWTYVRDDRPFGGTDPPAVAYFFSADRKSEHPHSHLEGFEGILQADAYAGFKRLYEPDPITGRRRIREAACWAHWRRDFHDVWKATKSPIAHEALQRIGKLYDIEREITGRPLDERLKARHSRSAPLAAAFKTWLEQQLPRISGKSDLAKAIRYGLSRWHAFTLFLTDGTVAIDNNAAERAIRPLTIGRRNWLFAGSHAGGENLADILTLIESAKFSGLNPQTYLADVLARINDHKINRLSQLLPWNWQPAAEIQRHAA
jgi:transposase